jgi:hypothetical protein
VECGWSDREEKFFYIYGMNKRLFTGFAPFDFLWALAVRIGAGALLILILFHLDENTFIKLILAGICLVVVVITGDDQIVIYQDRIVHSRNSLLSFIWFPRGKTYRIANLRWAYLQREEDEPLFRIRPYRNTRIREEAKPIFLELKSGRRVKLETRLERSDMEKVVEIVNSLVAGQ